ncbi:MAG: hypothetical protein QM726_19340 [Chitinophagaceae bacterium]
MNPTLSKVLLFLISLVLVLVFVLPFAWVIVITKNDEAKWKRLYLVEDWATLIFYLPFVILWVIFLIKKEVLSVSIFRFLLALTAFFPFFISAESIVGGQDYQPDWGVFSSLLIFPLAACFLLANRRLTKLTVDSDETQG